MSRELRANIVRRVEASPGDCYVTRCPGRVVLQSLQSERVLASEATLLSVRTGQERESDATGSGIDKGG